MKKFDNEYDLEILRYRMMKKKSLFDSFKFNTFGLDMKIDYENNTLGKTIIENKVYANDNESYTIVSSLVFRVKNSGKIEATSMFLLIAESLLRIYNKFDSFTDYKYAIDYMKQNCRIQLCRIPVKDFSEIKSEEK
jgi:hypothetical protein